jgi:hypothetical protein
MRKALKIAGMIYLFLAGIVILIGYASITYFQGVGVLLEILSPFNVWNFIAVVVTLAPGLIMLHFGSQTKQ